MIVTDKKYAMSSYMSNNLDLLKEAVKKNWDGWIIYTGIEGSGKTTLAAAHGYYLSYNAKKGTGNFTVDNFVWTVEQFIRAITTAKPGSVIIWDEAVFGLLSSEAMTNVQRTLTKYATTIRKRRLFIFLVIPYVWMLGKYFVSRCRAMINARTPDGISRGSFRFYNKDQMLYLYAEGKKHWRIPAKCHGSFNDQSGVKSLKQLGIDQNEYEARKDEAINGIFEGNGKTESRDDRTIRRLYQALEFIKNDKGLIWRDVINTVGLDMTETAITRGYTDYKKKLDEESSRVERKRFRAANNIFKPKSSLGDDNGYEEFI